MTELEVAIEEAIQGAIDCHLINDGDGRFDQMVDVDVAEFQAALRFAGYEVTRLAQAEHQKESQVPA